MRLDRKEYVEMGTNRPSIVRVTHNGNDGEFETNGARGRGNDATDPHKRLGGTRPRKKYGV